MYTKEIRLIDPQKKRRFRKYIKQTYNSSIKHCREQGQGHLLGVKPISYHTKSFICLPLLHFPSIIPIIVRYYNLSLLMKWQKKKGCLVFIYFIYMSNLYGHNSYKSITKKRAQQIKKRSKKYKVDFFFLPLVII